MDTPTAKPKRKSSSSPTKRSLQLARGNGWIAAVVERWNAYARIRQDLFGCIDLLLIDPTCNGVLGVQACAGASHAARRAKAIAEPRLRVWLNAGQRFQVWSWAKQGARGKRKTWTMRCEVITLADLPSLQEPTR